MSEHTLFGFQVEINEDATRSWYASASLWGCNCGHCQNFLALARQHALSPSFLETLNRLGIPPEKATYVCNLYSNSDGHLYQFSYRIAGSILAEPDAAAQRSDARCCHEPYPYGAPGFPEPHFDLEFFLTLPWILPEQ